MPEVQPTPGAMEWDFASPRACMPSLELQNCDFPVVGTASHALSSPLPYGLGVYSVSAKGVKRALPLYYVSEKVALSRKRGVKPGWYVVAVPGVGFELRVTAVQENFPQVWGVPLEQGYDVKATVLVDEFPIRSYKCFGTCGYERAALGFTESSDYADGARKGDLVVRKFVFQKADVVEDGSLCTGDPVGSIIVQISSGKVAKRDRLKAQVRKENLKENDRKIAEKEAAKAGKSIKVSREGDTITLSKSRSRSHMPVVRAEGTFVVFLRERFWMESRNLISSDGRPWAPVKEKTVIDVDNGDEQNMSKTSRAKRTKREHTTTDKGTMPLKKAKREPVHLTKIQDVLDLTSD